MRGRAPRLFPGKPDEPAEAVEPAGIVMWTGSCEPAVPRHATPYQARPGCAMCWTGSTKIECYRSGPAVSLASILEARGLAACHALMVSGRQRLLCPYCRSDAGISPRARYVRTVPALTPR